LDFSLCLAHYDHGIRSAEDSAREKAFVLCLGERLGLSVETGGAGEGRLAEAARREKKSLEAAAREFRYSFLREAAERAGCAFIALGHTRSDRIETQLYRFFQGSFPGRLSGIAPRRGECIRPLLSLDKGVLLAFLAERGEGFCVDSSNGDSSFLRNHIRASLVPAVKEVFPGYETALDALAEKARLYEDFAQVSLAAVNPWIQAGEGWECSFAAFLALHPLLRLLSVYALYNGDFPRGGEARLPYAFLAPLVHLRKEKAEGTVLRGFGIHLFLRGGRLFWRRVLVLKQKKGYFYTVAGNMDFPIHGQLLVHTEEVSGDCMNEEDVFPVGDDGVLFLRSRRLGDTLVTAGGAKTLNKLFSGWKAAENIRDMIPVLQKNDSILAVLGRPFGWRTLRLSEEAGRHRGKFLRIRVSQIGVESGQQKQF
jgi:tRNA(Ile)-lysidine synthase